MGIVGLVSLLVSAVQILIFARVIFSWVPGLLPFHPVRRWVYDMTEPLLAPIRSRMPASAGLDFSPLILLMIVWFVGNVLQSFARGF